MPPSTHGPGWAATWSASHWMCVESRSQVSSSPYDSGRPHDGEAIGADGLAALERLIREEQAGVPGTGSGVAGQLHRLCEVLVRVLPASHAGISLWGADGVSGGIVAHVGADSRELEELQFTLGEGPCIEACSTRRVVLEPDLAGRGTVRWAGYGPAASERGVRAVFAFPLGIGSACLGSLDVYRTMPGPLSGQALKQGFWFAEIALQMVLDGQDEAGPQRLAAGLDDALAYRLEVYQAQGMVMVDLGVSLAEAMVRLRAHAFATDRTVNAVAKDIVAGRLRLDPDPPRADVGTEGGAPDIGPP